MELVNSVILGIIQGVTEFLPISSTGHLIIFRDISNTQFSYSLAFDAILQLATTLAILFYFRIKIWHLIKNFVLLIAGKKIDEVQKTIILAIGVGTIPAVVFGLLAEDYMETIFRNSFFVAFGLIFGSIVMFLADYFYKANKKLTIWNSVVIGLFQSLALIPGMSRSGMSISGGLFVGLSKEEAVNFSFILAIPVLLGTGLKKIFDLGSSGLLASLSLELIVGSIVAFIFGLLAIKFLVSFLKRNNFNLFIYYRLILALIIIAVVLI